VLVMCSSSSAMGWLRRVLAAALPRGRRDHLLGDGPRQPAG
jgi:hypothetical protein